MEIVLKILGIICFIVLIVEAIYMMIDTRKMEKERQRINELMIRNLEADYEKTNRKVGRPKKEGK